ncbi:MAG: dihydrodipicolinate synthase family protein [Chitinophagaceae bacterium]
MEHLTTRNLEGTWGTLLLPINHDNSIDFIELGHEIDYLVQAEMAGIYSNGTAGEFYNQTENEFDKIQDLLSAKCRAGNMRFQVGASHPSPIVSLERIKRCTALKPDGFQVILPDWVPTNAEEQVNFLQTCAEAAGTIPLILYHPPHAKVVLKPADYSRIKKEVPQIIGIKVGWGDGQWFEEMRGHTSGLAVFVPGHFLATGIKEQLASGSYSNMACLSPQGAVWWWQLMQTDVDSALEVQGRIKQFLDEFILPLVAAGFSNPALDKFLAAVGGWSNIGTRLRWPYKWVDESTIAATRKKAAMLLPEFFQ